MKSTTIIPLTQGQIAVIDSSDAHLVAGYKWFALKDRNTFYATAYVRGAKPRRRVLMHRLVLGSSVGPRDEVDHRDGNGLNNRRKNLRLATRTQNVRNVAKYVGLSRFKGVSASRTKTKPWRARIQANGKSMLIGHFATEIQAAVAYDNQATALFGDFARLNFPANGMAAASPASETPTFLTDLDDL